MSSKKKSKSKSKDTNFAPESGSDDVSTSGNFKVLFGKSGGMGHSNRISLNQADMNMLTLKPGGVVIVEFETGGKIVANAFSSAQTTKRSVVMSRCWQSNFGENSDRCVVISRDINEMIVVPAAIAAISIAGDVPKSHIQFGSFRCYVIAALAGCLLSPGVSLALTWRSAKLVLKVCIHT